MENDIRFNNQGKDLTIAILIPLICLFSTLLAVFCLQTKFEQKERNKYKICFLIALQYLILPFFIFIIIINTFLILFSKIFLKKIFYLSSKNFCNFVYKIINKTTGATSVKKIKIIKSKNLENIIPERANKYIENSDISKSGQPIIINNNNSSSNNNIINNNTSNIVVFNLNNNSKFNSEEYKINGLKIKENNTKDNINNNNNNIVKPNLNLNKKKNKFLEFLNNALVNEDNTPSYINLIKSIKEASKENKEKENRSKAVNNVAINQNI